MKHRDYVQNLTFDTRLVEWNMKNKVITQDELSKHLKELPESQNYEMVKIEDLRYER
ncbi:MAG TPA: hypothetical protein VFV50_01485 [Bdellovibrionales bacterium]|nr:hypothetical protein [Bdellovibrionales bacterium]